MKKRVMVVGEASFLSTGFAVYGRELLRRLYDSGRYELMEYAAYSPWGDPRAREVPWRHKTASYDPHAPGEKERFLGEPLNQFGQFRFEEACVEFRPDAVLSFRDWWHDEFIERSPFRRFYRHCYMPTVDAVPQTEQWLATHLGADAVLTYSDWAQGVLREAGGGRINLIGTAPAGAELDVLRPVGDKRAHKEALGLEPDVLLVGTVMRNQRRKLFPDLFEGFARFLRDAPEALAQRSYLYCHTSWPDVGWDLPGLLKQAGLCSRVLFTYHCSSCGRWFPCFFRDALTACIHCSQLSARLPNVRLGLKTSDLAEVYNLFDCYVQCANSEGQGIPAVEAAACGLPVLAVDYSAMSDVVRKVHGVPLRTLALPREVETGCRRAVPDQADLARELLRVLSLPEPVRSAWGHRARAGVKEHYDWDKTASAWMNWLDGWEAPPPEKTWSSPPLWPPGPSEPPPGLSHADFIRWGMVHVAGRPDLQDSYLAMRLTRDLNWGTTMDLGHNGSWTYMSDTSLPGSERPARPFGRNEAYTVLANMAGRQAHWEKVRQEGRKA